MRSVVNREIEMEKNTNTTSPSSEQRAKTRIVLFPLPVQGHITPMLHLADALHSKGFSITIIHTLFNSPNPSNFPNFTFHFIAPEFIPATLGTPAAVLAFLYAAAREPFRDALSSRLLSQDIACLIADPLWPFTREVAEKFKLTRLVLRTASLSSFLGFDAVPLLVEKGYLSLPDAHLEEPVPELPPLKIKDLPSKTAHELVAGIVRETKNSHGIIWNSFEELEGPELALLSKGLPIPFFLIGPLNKFSTTSAGSFLTQDKHSIISWLDSQAPNSVLYVSFGSNSKLTEAEFVEIAWGLADSKIPFLWVVRTNMVQDSEMDNPLPHGFLEAVDGRGHIVEWAPQKEVLAHQSVGGFWTHSGWNSTMESISEGVPLICMPCMFPDQKINAAFASEVWKIALRVEKGARRDEVAKLIKELMVEKVGDDLRERVALLKYKADRCLAKGGSSYESLERLTSFILSL